MRDTPGEIELRSYYSKHLGPRYAAAGLTIQFHYNQIPGLHFKVEPSESGYRSGIERGIEDGMKLRFPNFPSTGSIWIKEIEEHPVDSSEHAFYCIARSIIDQAFFLSEFGSLGRT